MDQNQINEALRRAKEAKERAEKATPGRWFAVSPRYHRGATVGGMGPSWLSEPCRSEISIRAIDVEPGPGFLAPGGMEQHARDATFVAHAREDVPDLASDVEALAKALRAMTADRDHLKRRETDIIEAVAPVADGGQWRADIEGAIKRQRRELQEAREEIERLKREQR